MSGKEPNGIPVWEWGLAILGGFLSFGSIVFMLYTGWTGDDSPPQVLLRATSILSQGAGYLVRFEAKNIGNTTAAQLRIRGSLKSGEEIIETSEATIDYLPADSRREGGFFFARDPDDFQLEMVAEGYEQP